MKTLKVCIVMCVFTVFTVNNVNAQNRVQKYDVTEFVEMILPCTGERILGEVTVETWLSDHNWLTHVRKSIAVAYDESGNKTNEYEVSQTFPGLYFSENTGTFKLDGKVIAVFHISYHTTTNANGDVVIDRFIFTFNCK
jgi:hypothetical protein